MSPNHKQYFVNSDVQPIRDEKATTSPEKTPQNLQPCTSTTPVSDFKTVCSPSVALRCISPHGPERCLICGAETKFERLMRAHIPENGGGEYLNSDERLRVEINWFSPYFELGYGSH